MLSMTDWTQKIEWTRRVRKPIPAILQKKKKEQPRESWRNHVEDAVEQEVAAIEWIEECGAQPWLLTKEEMIAVRRACNFHPILRSKVVLSTLHGPDPTLIPVSSVWYHPLDTAFLLDEIKRKEAHLRHLSKMEGEAQKRLRVILPEPEDFEISEKPRMGNGQKRGPTKKELNVRRTAQFGMIMHNMGFWESRYTAPSEEVVDERIQDMNVPWHARISYEADVDASSMLRRLREEEEDRGLIPTTLAKQICLLEYSEPNPLMRCHPGMNSVIVLMTRKALEGQSVFDSGEYDTLRGMPLELLYDEPSPLLMNPATNQIVPFLYNRAMNIPLFEQKNMSNGTVYEDFLVFPSSRELVAIETTYLCGQVEPRVSIPHPCNFIRDELGVLAKYIAYEALCMVYDSEDLSVSVSTMHQRFPFTSSTTVDKYIRSYLESESTTTWRPCGWAEARKHLTQEELMRMMRRSVLASMNLIHTSPTFSNFCQWKAMDKGVALLHEAGIHRLVTPTKTKASDDVRNLRKAYHMHTRVWKYALNAETAMLGKPANAAVRDRELNAMKYVLRELLRTPWYTSNCFQNLFSGIEEEFNPFPPRTVLQVGGFAEPSGRGEMVSFQPSYKHLTSKERIAWFNQSADEMEKAEDGGEELIDARQSRKKKNGVYMNTKKPKFGGTENDIRILTMKRLGEILVELHVPPEEVAKIGRWDRAWFVEQAASSKHGKLLLGGSIEKYDRLMMPEGVDEAVKTRRNIEKSPEFVEMRKECTLAYERLAQVATDANDKYHPETIKAVQKRKNAALYKQRTIDDEIQEDLMESQSLDNFKARISEKAANEEMLKRNKAEFIDLMGWAEVMEARRKKPPRKMIKRTVIEVPWNGPEIVKVTYDRAPSKVQRFVQAQKAAEEESGWEEVHEIDGGIL